MKRSLFFLLTSFLSLGTITSCRSDKRKAYEQAPGSIPEILDSLYRHQKFPGCFIRNELAEQYFEKRIAALDKNSDAIELARLQLGLADQLISDNRVDTAIVILKHIRQVVRQTNELSPSEKKDALDIITNSLCVAFVRKGELQNCATNHNATSCILPLQAEALHRDESGSDSAVAYLVQYLHENPKDSRMIWLLNIAAATINRHPQAVPQEFRIDFDKYSRGNNFARFTDVAAEKDINRFGHFGGVGVEDFNNDGLPDIFVTSTPLNANVRLYLQTRDSGFVDYTQQAGLTGITGGGNTHHADFDNDGLTDILITRGGWLGASGFQPNSLLKNKGNGRFEDVTIKAGLLSYKITHTACWADFNNDGWLDFFAGHENQSFDEFKPGPFADCKSELFLNNKNGTFTEVGSACGINITAWVKGSVWLDYNRDALPDLYVSVFGENNLLYRNDGADKNGQTHFTEVAKQAGVDLPVFSFPVAAFDINQDGWDDIFVNGFNMDNTSMGLEYLGRIAPENPVMVFINQKNGTFKEEAKVMGLNRSIYAMSLNYGDLDLDGFPDLYCGTGYGDLAALFPNILLQNKNGQQLLDVTSASGTGHLQKGHGIAISDIDCDGDNDIYTELGGFLSGDGFWNACFENPGNNNQWISLKLQGTRANRSAIGARIKLTVTHAQGTQEIYARIATGGTYGCSQLQQLIGLGQATAIQKAEVFWPGETTAKIYSGLELKKAYRLIQKNSVPELLEYTAIKSKAASAAHHQH